MYICLGVFGGGMGHVRPVAGPGKVGIIISLTLNKWPSRVWRDPGSGDGLRVLGPYLGPGLSPLAERKNFRITHLCAIFKLTIVNFALVSNLASSFHSFLFCFPSSCGLGTKQNAKWTQKSWTKNCKYINLTVCLLKIHFFLAMLSYIVPPLGFLR